MDKLLNYSLSSSDISNATNDEVKIMTYPELTKYNDLDDAFGNRNSIALLYPFKGGVNSSMYGHWTLLMRNDRLDGPEIEFFDSYNYKPDDQLKFAKGGYRDSMNMRAPYLTKLLLKAIDKGYNIEYNDNKHQSKDPLITTCGRHVVVRYLLRNLDIDRYNDFMKKLQKKSKLRSDELVTYLTQEIE
jgi:hypothetical protein